MPISPGTHVLYTVRAGDTLYSIANGFGTNVPSLIQINSWYPPVIEPDRLYPGQALLVRLPGMSEQSAVQYQAIEGDTLFRIAERFGVGVEMLAALNGLERPDILRVAQLIYIPAFVYEVEAGDTLYGIARRFGRSLNELIRANRNRPGFSPDVLFPGFRFVVPLPASTNIAVFQPLPGGRVAPGERLTGVARAFEAGALYRIVDAAGGVVAQERALTASEGAPAFGRFDAAIAFDRRPSTSAGTLLVYTRSANDGSVQDLVEVPIAF
ncbi:LysM peptidoglycan-binding domain-containing protein [Paenibacillus antri]|uniref:LysM peptidoglycan-binding domain-containing protein n=1 Tax=Paenibacillus antri TaxID=2582848 RepID=A0A5R9G2V0_9BACL|nr:LysM peptidoglycan-binding domain-containing protein [Paenibacillus antri]TLS50682.1 LysM peptidoglycan-binding domain-containing protein [Paenibacillus antri]